MPVILEAMKKVKADLLATEALPFQALLEHHLKGFTAPCEMSLPKTLIY